MSTALNKLKKGDSASIESLNEPQLALKLCEMGCTPGKTIHVISIAPLGGPYCIQVDGNTLSLRRDEAAHVITSPLS